MTTQHSRHGRSVYALLFGNFVIGSGVLAVAGALNDLVRSLHVSVALGGQLIAIGAAVMAFGAPLLAMALSGKDRRRLLTVTLLLYGLGHGLCALMPNYATLAPLRALTLLGAAVFTPQAAAAIGHMSTPAQRGRAITTVFVGWSMASVLGTPMHNYIAETVGWRWAFGLVMVLALMGSAWVWHAVPDGVKPPALSRAQWRAVFTHPALMAIVGVTALSAAGQFTMFSYMAPYFSQVLHASPTQMSLLFMCFGLFGLLGNVTLTRWVDRLGPSRAVIVSLALLCIGLSVWPFATTVGLAALAAIPWGLGTFSSNSAQQARLGLIAPTLAPALMALNTSAIYLGQAIGAASGGVMLSVSGFRWLAWVGTVWILMAMATSLWAGRHLLRHPVSASMRP